VLGLVSQSRIPDDVLPLENLRGILRVDVVGSPEKLTCLCPWEAISWGESRMYPTRSGLVRAVDETTGKVKPAPNSAITSKMF
jgi:hypothetical protein